MPSWLKGWTLRNLCPKCSCQVYQFIHFVPRCHGPWSTLTLVSFAMDLDPPYHGSWSPLSWILVHLVMDLGPPCHGSWSNLSWILIPLIMDLGPPYPVVSQSILPWSQNTHFYGLPNYPVALPICHGTVSCNIILYVMSPQYRGLPVHNNRISQSTLYILVLISPYTRTIVINIILYQLWQLSVVI